jgi:hypothetical protein
MLWLLPVIRDDRFPRFSKIYYITQAHMCNISKHNNIIQYINIEKMEDILKLSNCHDILKLSNCHDILKLSNCHDILKLRNKYIPNYFTTNFSESSKVWFHTQFLFENRIKVYYISFFLCTANMLFSVLFECLLSFV